MPKARKYLILTLLLGSLSNLFAQVKVDYERTVNSITYLCGISSDGKRSCYKSVQTEYYCDSIVGITRNGVVTLDSFLVLSNVDVNPQFLLPFDSIRKLVRYPQMEKDNDIEGAATAIFKINDKGGVDTMWLSRPISPGLSKEINRFLLNEVHMIPAKRANVNVSCYCQITFQFMIRKKRERIQ